MKMLFKSPIADDDCMESSLAMIMGKEKLHESE